MLALDPHGEAPLLIGWDQKANWLQYFDWNRRDTLATVEQLLGKVQFLDPRLVVLLSKLEDCMHFKIISSAVSMPLRNTDMGLWADGFHGYCQICEQLTAFAAENLRLPIEQLARSAPALPGLPSALNRLGQR